MAKVTFYYQITFKKEMLKCSINIISQGEEAKLEVATALSSQIPTYEWSSDSQWIGQANL